MVQWVESPAMSLLWHAWELPHALVVAKKKKKVLGLMEFPFYARVTDRQKHVWYVMVLCAIKKNKTG